MLHISKAAEFKTNIGLRYPFKMNGSDSVHFLKFIYFDSVHFEGKKNPDSLKLIIWKIHGWFHGAQHTFFFFAF